MLFNTIRGSTRWRGQQFRQRRRYISSLLHADHPFNSSPGRAPPHYHGKTKPVPQSLMHHLQMQNEQHQDEIANVLRPHYQSQTPHLLHHSFAGCDAIYFWRSLEYWRVAVGEDTDVEVEIGSYNSGKRVAMKFGDYLDYLSLSIEKDENELENKLQEQRRSHEQNEVAYLAQNELFPQVVNDVPIPSFCCEPNGSYNVGEGKLYHTMLWMGPRNTVSPLHYDPLDNLLIQIVGLKRVLLFQPGGTSLPVDATNNGATSNSSSDTLWHYAGVDGNQYNTSAVEIEHPDYEKYPNFKSAPVPFECILGPGDALFIPKKWWHHVHSLEWSISANVWWR